MLFVVFAVVEVVVVAELVMSVVAVVFALQVFVVSEELVTLDFVVVAVVVVPAADFVEHLLKQEKLQLVPLHGLVALRDLLLDFCFVSYSLTVSEAVLDG